MNLTNTKTVKNLCHEYNIRPSKRLGQNFLIDKNILNKIIVQADLKRSDLVLEIGPGFGALTFELAKYVKQVIAVEKDGRLSAFTKAMADRLRYKNIEIINGDVLKLDVSKILLNGQGILRSAQDKVGEYKIISNLPYQITSPVLWRFLYEEKYKPKLMMLMIQKEVVERICVKSPNMNLLAIMVQFYGQPKIVKVVSKTCFYPMPKVDAAILRISRINADLRRGLTRIKEEEFFKIVKIGFASKRKMLKNNLAKALKIPVERVARDLQQIGLDEKVRAQELRVEEWVKLINQFFSVV